MRRSHFAAFPLAAILALSTAAPADEDLGPPIYLADLHEQSDRTFLHWKYNFALPDFTTVKVLDAAGDQIGVVQRPVRMLEVTGRRSPFRLIPIGTSGTADSGIEVKDGPPLPAVPFVSRIGIRSLAGRAQFIELASGRVFHPAGMNYVPLRHGDHAAFVAATAASEAFYDPWEAEACLRLLRRSGYNTVRVFLAGRRAVNPGLAGEPETVGVYTPYLDNVADFLRRAASHGIHVIMNFADMDLPQNNYFKGRSGRFAEGWTLLHSQGVAAHAAAVTSSLTYLKSANPGLLKTILAVQFNNEVWAPLTAWPFDQTSPVLTANGRSYDMTHLDQRARCYEEGLDYYYRQMCAAVKAVDPELLTCEGVFLAAAVGRDHRHGAAAYEAAKVAEGFEWDKHEGYRIPPPLGVLALSPLDFVDIHIYPTQSVAGFPSEVVELLESSRFSEAAANGLGTRKLVILGEFGTFKHQVKNHGGDGVTGARRRWQEVRRVACGDLGFAGYLGWSLETFEQTGIFHALGMGPDFLQSFRDGFAWPAPKETLPGDPTARAANPLKLNPVSPNGASKGFLAPSIAGSAKPEIQDMTPPAPTAIE